MSLKKYETRRRRDKKKRRREEEKKKRETELAAIHENLHERIYPVGVGTKVSDRKDLRNVFVGKTSITRPALASSC